MNMLLCATILGAVLLTQADQCVSMGGACAAGDSSRYTANSNSYAALLANLPQRSPQPTRTLYACMPACSQHSNLTPG